MRPGGGFPSCCFLAVAPNILDFWHGLAHREKGVLVLCYPGVWLRDGGSITVQCLLEFTLLFPSKVRLRSQQEGVGSALGVQEGRGEPVEPWAA